MFVLKFSSCALLNFFASTVCAASVGLYAGTFDPLTRAEERIIRCALGDTDLSRECQKFAKEISRVVILVNEDGEQDTLASTRERVLMVTKAFQGYGGRVEIVASTPPQIAERVHALLADQNVEQLFRIIGPESDRGLESISAGYDHKIVRVIFPLEQNGSAFRATMPSDDPALSGAREVIAKLGLYQPLGEDLAELQRSLFEEGWRDFLDDLNSACPDMMNQEICGELASKWKSISIISDDQAARMDRSESAGKNLLVYNQSQSEDRWAETFSKTATKFLEGSDSHGEFRAVADDLTAKTVRGYPYGKLPHLRRVLVQNKFSSVEPLKVTEKPVVCSAADGSYHMDVSQYLADRFPKAFVRFLSGEFRRSSSAHIDLYVHNHSIDQAYEFHRRDQFATFYFLQTRRGQLHRDIYLAVKSEPRAYRVVLTSVRGNDRKDNVLCQIHRTGIFADYRFVQSKQAHPLFVLNSQGHSLTLNENDLLLFGFKGNWSRMLAALNWKKISLVKEGLDIDLFTHPTAERKLVIARNVYGDDTDIVLDTFYKKGLRKVIYLGSTGAIADYQIGDVVIPNEFINRNADSVPFHNNFAQHFQPELSRLLTVHGQKKQGWVPTLFDETKGLLLDWRAKSIGSVDIEGLHLGKFARLHPGLKMGVFFVVSDQTLGESTINETNAHRGIIDASANHLISFLITKLLRP
jgi:uridine phosphorylase/phosphopantetheine adenylyltransferase